MRFKEEQLENYQGNPLGYSASDYHHISRPVARAVIRRSQSSNGVRHSRMYSRPSLSEIMFPPEVERYSAHFLQRSLRIPISLIPIKIHWDPVMRTHL